MMQVFIDGVLLQSAPIDVNLLSKSHLRDKLWMNKRAHLDKVEAQLELAHKKTEQQSEPKRKMSYTEKLIVKILDNLEVTVTNVHIRYEDSLSCSGVTFAAGVSLGRFTVATTEWNWSKTFLSRDKVKQGEGLKIHKLINVENLAYYWEQVEVPLSTLAPREWELAMMSLIFQDTVLAGSTDKFILAPPNNICVKLIHMDKSSEIEPKLDVTFEGLNLEFRLSKLQLAQIILTLNTFYALDRQKLVALYRPEKSVKQDPRAWWKYAYVIISGKKGGFAANVEEALLCHRYKASYIDLLKRKRALQSFNDDAEQDLISIERALPLCALVVFRGLALKEYYKELSEYEGKAKIAAEKSPTTKSSWFSWGGKKKESTTLSNISDDEEISFESLTTDLEEGSVDDEFVDSYILRIRLRDASSSLEIHRNGASIALAMLSYNVSLDVRVSGVSAAFTVDNLIVLDRVTTSMEYQAIVAPRVDSEEEHKPFLVAYNARPDHIDISVTSFPLIICFNRMCTKALIDYFTFSVDNDTSSIYLRKKMLQIISPYLVGTRTASEINFFLDIKAPIIIIPEDNDGDTGCLHLDMGHLEINCAVLGSDFKFDSKISDVNACLPLKTRFQRVNNADDLISPFSMHLHADSYSKEVANIVINLDVMSPVFCVFDEAKFARLLKVMHLTHDLLKRKLDDKPVVKPFNPKNIPVKLDEEHDADDTTVDESFVVHTYVKFSLPCVTLLLNNSMIRNSIHSEMQNFDLKVVVSNVDTKIDIGIDSLKLNDDYGHILVWTKEDDSMLTSSAFVSMTFVSISSIRSPLYKTHANFLNVSLGNLWLNYNALILMILKPFYDAVQVEYANNKSRSALIAKKASKTMAIVVDNALNRKSLNGLQFTVSVDQVWLTLQSFDDENPVNNKMQNCFKVCAQSFSLMIELKTNVDILLKLSGLDLIDARIVSEYYVYKTLLTASSDRCLSRTDGLETGTDFLVLTFSDAKSSANEVDLILRDLTSFVSIDALLDLVYLTLEYTNGFKAFLLTTREENSSGFNNIALEAKEVGPKLESSALEKNISASIVRGKSLYVSVSVTNPTLLLLEDPLDKSSRGIIGCCIIEAHYNQDLDSCGNLQSDKLQLSLRDSDISVFRNIEDRLHVIYTDYIFQYFLNYLTSYFVELEQLEWLNPVKFSCI